MELKDGAAAKVTIAGVELDAMEVLDKVIENMAHIKSTLPDETWKELRTAGFMLVVEGAKMGIGAERRRIKAAWDEAEPVLHKIVAAAEFINKITLTMTPTAGEA